LKGLIEGRLRVAKRNGADQYTAAVRNKRKTREVKRSSNLKKKNSITFGRVSRQQTNTATQQPWGKKKKQTALGV